MRVLLNDMLKEAKRVLPNFHSHLTDITTYGDQLEKEREALIEEIKLQVGKMAVSQEKSFLVIVK